MANSTILKYLPVLKALQDGQFRHQSINRTLPSGRQFRYQVCDYSYRVNATESEIDQLATQIIKDKYRYCNWDRLHPHTDQEAEIFDDLKALMLGNVSRAQELKRQLEDGTAEKTIVALMAAGSKE